MFVIAPSRAAAPLCLLILLTTPALADSPDSMERRLQAWQRVLEATPEPGPDFDRDARPAQEGRPGSLQATVDGQLLDLPLLHTDVDAEISASLVDVQLTQVFSNPYDFAIEALYLFPLPTDAAVDDMWMQVDDQLVMAEIHPKEEAREIYEEAKEEGKTTALLQQWRPDTFTQYVANIPPGGRVDVSIHLVQPLQYRDGGYEWVFPLVVGPRFTPDGGTGDPDGDESEFVESIGGPMLAGPTGNTVEVFAWIDAGVPIRGIESPSHDLDIDPEDETADIMLAREYAPDRDFILRWTVAGETPELALVAHRDPTFDEFGTFLMVVQPPDPGFLEDEDIQPKEMVFVVDTSCSMSGFPVAAARDVMHHAIAGMNPSDAFWILQFNSQTSAMSTLPLPNSAANRARGRAYVDTMAGGGGSNMKPGLETALDMTGDGLAREVFILTDAEISNDRQVLSMIEQKLDSSRLFPLGIGTSPHRALLHGIARVGRGHADFIRPDGDTAQAVADFYDRIRSPLLTDVTVDIEGVETFELTPDPLPDLYAGEPIVILGRYRRGGEGEVVVSGQLRGEDVEYRWDIELPEREGAHASVSSLWARRVIEELEFMQLDGDRAGIVDEIVALSLAHRVMTKHTSFVAVAAEPAEGVDGPAVPIRVPRETPELLDHSAIFGPVPERFGALSGSSSKGLLADLSGNSMGGLMGNGGLGSSGHGYGGGGSGYGLGGLGTRGYGTAGAGQAQAASAGHGFYGKKDSRPVTSAPMGDPIILGAVDRSAIDRVVKQHLAQIRYVYQRALTKNPDLAGKVVVKFVIANDGSVSSAVIKSSTMNAPEVEKGIADRFMRFRFPAPKGGGIVIVSYPFVFARSDLSDGAPATTAADLATLTPTMQLSLLNRSYSTDVTDSILRDVRRRMRKVEKKWVDLAERAPVTNGAWELEVDVSPAGRVEGIRIVTDDLGLMDFADLLMEDALRWRLPSMSGEEATTLVIRVEFTRRAD